jgi:hypothetical protein
VRTEDERLDELIDRALARYGEAKSSDALAARVLQRAHRDRSYRVLRRIAVLALAATLLVVVVSAPRSRIRDAERHLQQESHPLPSLPPVRSEPVTFALARVPTRHRTELRKQPAFPGDAPITSEEGALLRLASYTTIDFSESTLTLNPVEVQPVQVAPVVVDDLKPNSQERN